MELNSVICGNALEILQNWPEEVEIDAVVTDPPYGVQGGCGGQLLMKRKADYGGGYFEDTPDYIADICVPIIQLCIKLFPVVVFTPGTRCMFSYPPPDDIGGFWSPAAPRLGRWGFSVFHPILYYGKDWRAGKGPMPNSTTMNSRAPRNGHPCPKPLDAMQWLVDKACKPGGTILDPFCGGGSILRAAQDEGRNYIGIDINPVYCEITKKMTAQESLILTEE